MRRGLSGLRCSSTILQVTTNIARQTPADLAKEHGHEDCFLIIEAAMQRQVPPHRTNLLKLALLHCVLFLKIVVSCFSVPSLASESFFCCPIQFKQPGPKAVTVSKKQKQGMPLCTNATHHIARSSPPGFGGAEADALALDVGVVEHVKAMFIYSPASIFSPFPPGTASSSLLLSSLELSDTQVYEP